MSILTIKTTFNIELKFKLASMLKRGLAWFVDLIVLVIYNFLAYHILLLIDDSFSSVQNLLTNNFDNVLTTILIFFIMLPSFFYHFIIQYLWNGKSVGKYMLGIKVINVDGGNTTLGQLMIRWILCLPNYLLLTLVFYSDIRYLMLFILAFGIFSIPDFIAIAILPKSQKLGDLAANTLVIESVYNANINDTFFEMHDDNKQYHVSYPDVILLNDKDINGLHRIVKNAKQSDDKYLLKIEQKIQDKTGIQNAQKDSIKFFEVLIADYNYLTQQKGI